MHKIIVRVATIRRCHVIQSSSRFVLTSSFNINSDYSRLHSSISLAPFFEGNNVHRYSITRYHNSFIWSQLRMLSHFSSHNDGFNFVGSRESGDCRHLDRWLLLPRRNFALDPSQSAGNHPSQTVSNQQPRELNGSIDKAKKPLIKRVRDEIMHYYHGFRLLYMNVGISTRLLWKIVKRNDLPRKERQQIIRTSADLLRLFPFLFILILPFGGLALPICARFYPYLLPSTFQSNHDKERRENQQLLKKLQMAKILLESLENAKNKSASNSEDSRRLTEIFNEACKKGDLPHNRDIIRFMDFFDKKITLESFSRPQLVALCRFFGLISMGPSSFLRNRLRSKLHGLRVDDQMIIKEGVDSLSESELREACQDRGMRGFHLSTEHLKSQLSQWLELSLDDRISPPLLLLSRVLYLPKNLPTTDQLDNTIIRTKKTKPRSLREEKIRKGDKL